MLTISKIYVQINTNPFICFWYMLSRTHVNNNVFLFSGNADHGWQNCFGFFVFVFILNRLFIWNLEISQIMPFRNISVFCFVLSSRICIFNMYAFPPSILTLIQSRVCFTCILYYLSLYTDRYKILYVCMRVFTIIWRFMTNLWDKAKLPVKIDICFKKVLYIDFFRHSCLLKLPLYLW